MVLFTPSLPGEITRRCKCGTVGICSPVRERSSFYVRSKRGDFEYRCRECSKRAATVSARKSGSQARYAARRLVELKADPVAYEAFRVRQREYAKRSREKDRERLRAYDREWGSRNRERRTESKQRWRDAHPEEDRVDRKLARERKGKPMAVVASPRNVGVSIEHPMPPFRAWLRRLIALERASGHEAPHKRVAARLKVSDRTLRRWLADPVDTVDEAIIDKAVTAHGGYMLWEILEADYDPADGMPDLSPRKRGVCAERGCGEPTDGRLCRVHAAERFGAGLSARLAEIREEFQDESKAMAAMGGATRAESKRNPHRSKVPSCCNPHCWAPREIGERFCPDCVELGYDERDMFS